MIIRSKAPLRIGLAGGGSDVSPYSDIYGGEVINATINKYAYCTLEFNDTEQIIFNSIDSNIFEKFNGEINRSSWVLPLHVGVYQYLKIKNRGITISTWVDVPWGSGLGASSALVVAMLACYDEAFGLNLGKYELADLAYKIEREYLQMSGGKQDQFSASFGGFNHMYFKHGNVTIDPMRLKREILNELEVSMMLCFTKSSRNSSSVISDQMEKIKQENQTAIEATHKIVEYVNPIKSALYKGNTKLLAEYLNLSWENKQKLADNVTNNEINQIRSSLLEKGALSAKISGAGNGGYLFLVVDPLKRNLLKKNFYGGENWLDFQFVNSGVEVWKL